MNEQLPTPAGAAAAKWVRLSRKGYPTIVRENRMGSKFSTRIKHLKQVHFVTLTEQADTSFTAALEARRQIQSGHWQKLKETVRLRTDCPTTWGDIKTHYEQYQPAPPKVLAAETKKKNLYALENFLRKSGLEPKDDLALTVLTGELVYKWKQAILADCRDKSPEDATRLCRSANSILIQARSIFADEAQTYFTRAAKLKLPASLEKFRNEPGFKQIAKTEYHAPTDLVVAKTFAHLTELNKRLTEGDNGQSSLDDRNEFIACWLALGFGLRASDITRAQKSHFQEVQGDIAFRPPWFGKNKKHTPEIRVQLDAWKHLGPILAGLGKDAYLIHGNKTERQYDVFRRISGWMKAAGWETTHHIHELRAWAGSYIADHAEGDGLRAAQIFLRHSSYATTEKFYGHHRKQQIAKVSLTIPKVAQPLREVEQPTNIVAMRPN